jgi:hypothetical protein
VLVAPPVCCFAAHCLPSKNLLLQSLRCRCLRGAEPLDFFNRPPHTANLDARLLACSLAVWLVGD